VVRECVFRIRDCLAACSDSMPGNGSALLVNGGMNLLCFGRANSTLFESAQSSRDGWDSGVGLFR
jgi:hypothetical protein